MRCAVDGAPGLAIVLVLAIDVTAYLLVRLHAALTAGQAVVFEFDHTLHSDDDPAGFIDRISKASNCFDVRQCGCDHPRILDFGLTKIPAASSS